MSSLDSKLAKANKLWNAAKKKKPEYENVVPDGVYVGNLTRAEVGESQNGRLQASFRVVISSGEYKGEHVNWWSGLATEDNVMYFQRDLARLGLEMPEDMNDLPDALSELEKEKKSIRIRVVTNGEYQNVRILKAVDVETEEPVDDESEEDEEDQEDQEEEQEEQEEEDEEEEDEKEEEKDEEEEDEDDEEDEEEEDEEEEEEEKEEAPEVEVGARVQFERKGKTLVGTVKKIDYEKELVKVKTDAGDVFKLSPDDISPAPATKVKKSK
jgi:flagellar biosynthesis GTPase FlhF